MPQFFSNFKISILCSAHLKNLLQIQAHRPMSAATKPVSLQKERPSRASFFAQKTSGSKGSSMDKSRSIRRLVMGETGLVDGNILATNCAVRGKIHGDIVVKEQLHLLETAFVDGNIQATSMVVDEGARHNGRSSIGSAK